NATPAAFAAALDQLRNADSVRWRHRAEQAHQEYLDWANLDAIKTPGALQMTEVIRTLARTLPADAIVTNGAGNFSAWVHRFWRWHEPGTQLAPTSGAMGYGVPAAVAAKAARPERTVLCFTGDGDFLMSGQELATAVQYELAIVIL